MADPWNLKFKGTVPLNFHLCCGFVVVTKHYVHWPWQINPTNGGSTWTNVWRETTTSPSDDNEVIRDLYSGCSCDDQRTINDVQWIVSQDAIQETKTNNKEKADQKAQKARKARKIQKRQGKDIKTSMYKCTPHFINLQCMEQETLT